MLVLVMIMMTRQSFGVVATANCIQSGNSVDFFHWLDAGPGDFDLFGVHPSAKVASCLLRWGDQNETWHRNQTQYFVSWGDFSHLLDTCD